MSTCAALADRKGVNFQWGFMEDGEKKNYLLIGIAHAGSDGTRRRTGGEVKGKDANGVGSQSSYIHTPHSSTASS